MMLLPPRHHPNGPTAIKAGSDADGEHEPFEAPDAAGSERRPGGAGRLLIVEDDFFVSMAVEAAALAAGYEVVEIVRTADDAVRAALDHRPDLVLMDIRLADSRDGIDGAIEIRERADISCLFVTAHADERMRERAASARPAGWLSKPFSSAALIKAVEKALG